MEYKLFNEFVQTFLVDCRDFLSGSGRTVLTRDSLAEIFQLYLDNTIVGTDQSFDEKLRDQFENASEEAKIVFAHASWLYTLGTNAMTAEGKLKAVKMSLFGMPEYKLRSNIFLGKQGIANPGTGYGTMKFFNILFILLLFKWIKGSKAGAEYGLIINAVIHSCLYASYDNESYLKRSFSAEKTRMIVSDCAVLRTKIGKLHKIGIYNYLLNLCKPDYYLRIVSNSTKTIIAEKAFRPEFIEGEGISLHDMNDDDKVYYVGKHYSRLYPDLDPSYALWDERVAPLWQSTKDREGLNYWVFQCNPKVYDIVSALRVKTETWWRVARHAKQIKIGDKVILWVTGDQSGCYALGEISGEIEYGVRDEEDQAFYLDDSYNNPADRIPIKLLHNLAEKPILKQDIDGFRELKDLKVGLQGTNFSATTKQYETLKRLAELKHNEYANADDKKLEDSIMEQSPQSHSLNQILYGPPGTGKTYNSINLAVEIADPEFMRQHRTRDEIKNKYQELVKEGRIVFTTFHQSMSYEDFIEGIKPITNEDQENNLTYEVVSGIFKRICGWAEMPDYNDFDTVYSKFLDELAKMEDNRMELATLGGTPFIVSLNSNDNLTLFLGQDRRKNGSLTKERMIDYLLGKPVPKYFKGYYMGLIDYLTGKYHLKSQESDKPNYVLIIDEINRGNVSQIFGELITLIEPDKRAGMKEALEVTLPYSKESFTVPPNLYIIGTMNTADRSVEALDTALRRRFTFKEFIPLSEIYDDTAKDLLADMLCGFTLKEILETINNRIRILLDRDHQIGHSYFLGLDSDEALMEVFNRKIIPLLQEYFYGDYAKIGLVLGKGFVIKEALGATELAQFDYDDADSLVRDNYQMVIFDDNAQFREALNQMMTKKNG